MDPLNALVVFANFVLIPAIAYGSQLALGALGVTLVYGVLRFSNFAHGDTMAFGAMIAVLATWWLQSVGVSIAPLPTALIALLPAILGTILLVLGTDRLVYRFYRKKKAAPVILVMVSIGVMFVMNGIVRLIIGVNDHDFGDGARFVVTVPQFREWSGLTEGLAIRTSQVITLVTAMAMVAALFWLLKFTRTGKAMRAFSDNEDLALASGIRPEFVVPVTWTLAAALAATAGTLYGLDRSFQPLTYLQLLLPIFAAAIVGGVGQPYGAIAGGLLVGFSETLAVFNWAVLLRPLRPYLPEFIEIPAKLAFVPTEYKIVVPFFILIVVLIWRPTGLFKGRVNN
jgi:branched-chain amino acid transport system permease protein